MVAAEVKEPTTVEKLRGLPWSIAGDTANTIFAQLVFFGSVFVLFLDELGLNKTQIGTLLSLIPFCGLLALVIAPTTARFGFKRTFVTFFGIRKVITVFLLLTPWVASTWGPGPAMVFVAAITAGFALTKAVADTAAFPWVQEYIPDSVRGKYYATSNLFTTIAAFLTVTSAGFVIARVEGLAGFMLLIAIGVIVGFVSVFSYSRVPGGAAQQRANADLRKLFTALGDANFVRYMVGISLIVVGFVPLLSFLPLFMREEVGLSESQTVFLTNGNLLGGLLAGYLWGWASDRYGSKPVMMSGLLIRLLLPLLWFLMPRHSEWSLYVALSIAVLQGFADVGWSIGSARLLFVSVVPAAQSMEYMALYYAWAGLITGLSQALGGSILDLAAGVQGQIGPFVIDPYLVLQSGALILGVLALWLFGKVRADNRVSTGQFAGLFFHGNPLRAIESIVRYQRARGERAAVFTTERLGQAHNRLAVDELLDALRDPRFNVRYEAIIAASRMPPDPRLTAALIGVLQGKSPALSVIAAWALGRAEDPTAIDALRAGMNSPYRSIQSHCARSLATLGDQGIIPLLLKRLPAEPDYGLKVAYASALGKLGTTRGLDLVLELLVDADDESTRLELALAVARMIGQEDGFIRLTRAVRTQPGTAIAQVLTPLRRKVGKLTAEDPQRLAHFDNCVDALAREDLAGGVAHLHELLISLPLERMQQSAAAILRVCTDGLERWGFDRVEYPLLALLTLAANP
jgi:HEAT repeat protein/Na+/melibiose symporter-like transporter